MTNLSWNDANEYVQWLHFAEGSAMLPLLLKLYNSRLGDAGAPLHPRINSQIADHLGESGGISVHPERLVGQGDLERNPGGIEGQPMIGDRAPRVMSRQTLAEVIEPRAEELFSLVQQVLRESGYEELLSSGIVLTGGSSLMQGMVELGEEIFYMPVRIALPRYAGGLADVVRSPRYATAMGLLLEGVQQVQQGQVSQQNGSVRAVFSRMRDWFQRNF